MSDTFLVEAAEDAGEAGGVVALVVLEVGEERLDTGVGVERSAGAGKQGQ